MRNALILHGMPDEEDPCAAMSNLHWVPWLQKELVCRGILTQTPELPHAAHPVYTEWAHVFEWFPVNEETLLVGHSCGAGFLVRWLSENRQKVEQVVLVAPWMDPKEEMKSHFFDFQIDPDLTQRVAKLTIFVSTDDAPEIHASVERIIRGLGKIEIVAFDNKGHFNFDAMGTEAFPELLQHLNLPEKLEKS